MHPVIEALKASGKVSDDDLEFLAEHGRAYEGRRLPWYIDRRERGSCFTTADEMEAEGEGRYVQGFALRPGSRRPLAHAWNASNGKALDAVWTKPDRCAYFGIPGRRYVRRLDRMSRPFAATDMFGWPVLLPF